MHQAITLLPALVFLLALWLMDSFKLVRRRSIALGLAYGAAAALGCEALHGWLGTIVPLDMPAFSRYVSPITEESAKALFVAVLIARRKVGFLVDAAVLGFAVGTGFATVENVGYLRHLTDAPLILWTIRGFGTSVLHGATASIAAMVTRALADRRSPRSPAAYGPGVALAVVIHSLYNHLLVFPLAAAITVLVALPVVVVVVFERSERATREWVGAGLDLDLELLRLLTSEEMKATRFGVYLGELRSHFAGSVLADMFCLLRLELELGVQAKARLMARQAGLEMPVDQDLHDGLAEWSELRRSIGPTGLLALEPLRVTSHRDDWHRHLLAQAGGGARWRRYLPWNRQGAGDARRGL